MLEKLYKISYKADPWRDFEEDLAKIRKNIITQCRNYVASTPHQALKIYDVEPDDIDYHFDTYMIDMLNFCSTNDRISREFGRVLNCAEIILKNSRCKIGQFVDMISSQYENIGKEYYQFKKFVDATFFSKSESELTTDAINKFERECRRRSRAIVTQHECMIARIGQMDFTVDIPDIVAESRKFPPCHPYTTHELRVLVCECSRCRQLTGYLSDLPLAMLFKRNDILDYLTKYRYF